MIEQNTQEWLEMRKTKVGASDCPIILGMSPWKTPYQLWEEKLGLKELPSMSPAMRRGHDLEEEARRKYEQYTGNIVMPEVVLHKDLKWMMASLDGISMSKDCIVEIKCPGKKDHDLAAQGKIPDKYYPQLQHQLEVSGLSHMHYFSYNEQDFHMVEVEKDESFVADMLVKEKEFYKNMVDFIPPTLSDKDYIAKIDDEWKINAKIWLEKKKILDIAKKEEDEYRKKLIEISGNQNCTGGGIKLRNFPRKGSVDYAKIEELKNVDLEKYRKPPINVWRISAQ